MGETSFARCPRLTRDLFAPRLGEHRQGPAGKRWQKSPPAASKRPNRRRNGMKIARRLGEERQRPAGKRWHILCSQHRNDLAGGEKG